MSRSILVREGKRRRLVVCAPGQTVRVGRDPSCELQLKDPHVSRVHVELRARRDERLEVRNHSRYGTFVNDVRVDGNAEAGVGDRLRVGQDYLVEVVGAFDPSGPRRDRKGLVLPQLLEDRYLLMSEVGRGGMGVVFEAHDLKEAGRQVAIKWLRAAGRSSEEMVQRFRREAMLQGPLGQWPGIVSVFDLGTMQHGDMYAVMEFVRGDSLEKLILDNALSRYEGVRLVARTARALEYCHKAGVVHRDVKPSNIMVTTEGQIRLTDFGVAKAITSKDGLTATGVMLGTPGFMAPEQISDAREVGPYTDVYALGALLYSVLTQGRLPARGQRLREVLQSVLKGDFDLPRACDPTIDAELETICLEALTVDTDERTSSSREFAESLEAWMKRVRPRKKVQLAPPKPKR